jgi:hypothetical protein
MCFRGVHDVKMTPSAIFPTSLSIIKSKIPRYLSREI